MKPFDNKTRLKREAYRQAWYGIVHIALLYSDSKDEVVARFARAVVRAIGWGNRINKGIWQAETYLCIYNGAAINRNRAGALDALTKARAQCEYSRLKLEAVRGDIEYVRQEALELVDVYSLAWTLGMCVRGIALKAMRQCEVDDE